MYEAIAEMQVYNTMAVKGGSNIRPFLFCGEISEEMKKTLFNLGYDPILLPAAPFLPPPVARHPDMLLAPYGEGFLVSRAYREAHRSFFDAIAIPLTVTDETVGPVYPDDVLLNAFTLADKVFGGKAISRYLTEGKKHIKVAQGYARCSVAFFGSGCVTSDPSLYAALTKEGIETLRIRSGHITLKGYNEGFIGGASLTLSPTLTAFFGRVEAHPDYGAMERFAAKQGVTLLSLSNEPLADCGGGFLYPKKHEKENQSID